MSEEAIAKAAFILWEQYDKDVKEFFKEGLVRELPLR